MSILSGQFKCYGGYFSPAVQIDLSHSDHTRAHPQIKRRCRKISLVGEKYSSR
jgi:hypothetical protein